MNTITTQQLEQIKQYCLVKGITFYDIQIEAMDHIATMIENRWEEHPEEAFDESLKVAVANIDWRPFKYKNDLEINTKAWWELSTKDKKVQLFASALFVAIIIIGLLNVAKATPSEHVYLWRSYVYWVLAGIYGLGSVWILYNFIKAKAMLSFAYKQKYFKGVFFSLLLLVQIYFRIDSFGPPPGTYQMLFMVSIFDIAMLLIFVYMFLVPINRARKKYPQLF